MFHATPKQLRITVPTFRVQPNIYGLLPGTSLEVIGWKSPRQYRLAAERLARYFAREEGYSLPYWHNEINHDPEAHRDRILLWTQRHYTLDEEKTYYYAYGACCMRWRRYRDAPDGWGLAWIWLHPYARRRGELTRVWPMIITAFPNIKVEPPLSPAMEHFFRKVNYQSKWESTSIK